MEEQGEEAEEEKEEEKEEEEGEKLPPQLSACPLFTKRAFVAFGYCLQKIETRCAFWV